MKFHNPLVGTTAMVSASAVRVAVQVAILPIIGRILGPQAYGQIALVSPFIFFSMLLADSGLSAFLVRADKLSAELEGTVFCFSALFSVLIILLFAALAWPLAHFLNEPLFPYLLMAMSSILLLAAFNIVPAALLLRTKRYEWIALSDIASSLGGILAVVLGVFLGWGVWSLVAQQIAFWLCKIAVVTIGSHYRPRLVLKWPLIKENIYFGSNLTGSSILGFIASNIDNVLIGAYMGTLTLGYYALAFQIVCLPQMVLSGSVYSTLFSSTSEAQRQGNVSPAQFLKALRGVMLISAPVMIGLAVTSPVSVPLFLGEKWLPMVPFIMLLTPFGLLQTAGSAMAGVLIGLGRSDIMFRVTLIGSIATIVAIMAGIWMESSNAVALGVSLTAFIGSWLLARSVVKECGGSFSKIGEAVAGPLIAATAMGGAVFLLQRSIEGSFPLAACLAISICAGMAVYVLVLFVFFRDQLALDIADIKAALTVKRQTP